MQRLVWVVVAALGLSGCQGGGAGAPDAAADEETVAGARAAVESLFEAMNAHDTESIVEHYDQSADFTYVGCTSVRSGFERLEPVLRAWHQSNQEARFESEIDGARALGRDAAVVTARATTGEDTQLFWSFVLERSGDRWLVAHEHESWADCPAPRTHPPLMPAGRPDEESDG